MHHNGPRSCFIDPTSRRDTQLRSRAAGLNVDVLNRLGAEAVSASARPASSSQPEAAAKSILGSGFTGQVGSDVRVEDALVQEYVSRRMAELSGRDTDTSAGAGDIGDAAAAAKARLYELPEHLRAVAPRGPKLDADVGEGGMMLAGTGISEVALPMDFKLRNIEDTEKAKLAYIARQVSRLTLKSCVVLLPVDYAQAARQKGDFAAMATLPSSALDDTDVQVRIGGEPVSAPVPGPNPSACAGLWPLYQWKHDGKLQHAPPRACCCCYWQARRASRWQTRYRRCRGSYPSRRC